MKGFSKKALFHWAKALVCLFFLGMVIHFPVHAKELILLSITADEFPNQKKHFIVNTNEQGDIKNIRLDTFSSKGDLIEKGDSMDVSRMAEGGLTLLKKEDLNVVTLKGDTLAAHNGGEVVVDYLKNGISGTRRKIELELDRQADDWKLRSVDGKSIASMHFKSNKFFKKTIGIEKIEINGEENSTKVACDGRPYVEDDSNTTLLACDGRPYREDFSISI
jgi:hypothetical protein